MEKEQLKYVIKTVLGTTDLSKVDLEDLSNELANTITENEDDRSSYELVLEQVEELVFKSSNVEEQLKAVASLPTVVFDMVKDELHMNGFDKLSKDRVYNLSNAYVITTENGVFYAEQGN